METVKDMSELEAGQLCDVEIERRYNGETKRRRGMVKRVGAARVTFTDPASGETFQSSLSKSEWVTYGIRRTRSVRYLISIVGPRDLWRERMPSLKGVDVVLRTGDGIRSGSVALQSVVVRSEALIGPPELVDDLDDFMRRLVAWVGKEPKA